MSPRASIQAPEASEHRRSPAESTAVWDREAKQPRAGDISVDCTFVDMLVLVIIVTQVSIGISGLMRPLSEGNEE